MNKSSFPPLSHRYGVTIMELLIVSSLLTFATGSVTALILTWRGDERALRREQLELRELQRIHLQLQNDMLDVLQVAVEESQVLRIEQRDGASISYRIAGPRVIRVVTSGDTVRARDSFWLHQHGGLRWTKAHRASGGTVRLVWEEESPADLPAVAASIQVSWRQ